MSNFKRNSSRFNRGGSSSQSSEGSNQGSSRGSYSRGNTGNGGGNRSGGSKGDNKFTRIGSLTVPKSASDEMADAAAELRGSDLRLNCQVYLGKGDNELTLKSGDLLSISFRVNEKDKDFVLGSVSVLND